MCDRGSRARFELVRRLGPIRLDHSCVSVSWVKELGGEFTWTGAIAGSYAMKSEEAAARLADRLHCSRSA